MEMEPAQKHYLIVYLAIVIPVALSFLFMRRTPKDPVRLRMKDDGDGARPVGPGSPSQPQSPQAGLPPATPPLSSASGSASDKKTAGGQAFRPSGWKDPAGGSEPYPRPRAARPEAASVPREKSLNVLFNWNGHSWDAYEVLGLPAGSSFEAAENAYVRAMHQASEDGKPFIRAAFEAIAKTV